MHARFFFRESCAKDGGMGTKQIRPRTRGVCKVSRSARGVVELTNLPAEARYDARYKNF